MGSPQTTTETTSDQSPEVTAAIEHFLKQKKLQFSQQQQAIADLREFMAYKGMDKHPYLGYTLDAAADNEAVKNHFAPPARARHQRQARNENEPQVANDGQAIEWMDRLFSFIQLLVIGGIVFHRTAGGNWMVFFGYFAGLLLLVLLFKGFFRPQRRQGRDTNNQNSPVNDAQPQNPGFFRVFWGFISG